MSRRCALLLAVVCAACKPAPPATPKALAGPTVRATVVTIRTTIQPGNRRFEHAIVIRGDQARSTAEHDTWRLFDVKTNTVTLVDDIARTFRTEPIATRPPHEPLPPHYPSARFLRGTATKPLLGVTARQSLIESGAYRRELWIAVHPRIPRGLFAMMQAAEPPSSPLAPMMRAVDDALGKVEGFPLVDHAEVPYGEKTMVIDRVVVSVIEKDVPEATIVVPRGYRRLQNAP